MRPITKLLATASLAVLAVTLSPGSSPAAATTDTGAAAAEVGRVAAAEPPAPKQDWIYSWDAPVQRQESWCEAGQNPIVCHTQNHRLYPTVTITAVNRQKGLQFSGGGGHGVATVQGLLAGCYDTTISVTGLGRYVSRNEAITMSLSRKKRFLTGGGMSGVKRFTLRDGNHTYRECA